MSRLTNLQINRKGASGITLSGQWRFILLILGFNVLLIVTLFLSMRQQELIEEYEWIIETRLIIEEQVSIQEAVEPVTITVVVEPGFTPPATPDKP
ncbi:MAG: hypothetical protein B6I34_02945 [Anaerolineaceae bacterium 4572_32.1]|nr:MAG: hypothetical protein B6I34_02945 [Anaerolineaceae bacterium 4572_32.1]